MLSVLWLYGQVWATEMWWRGPFNYWSAFWCLADSQVSDRMNKRDIRSSPAGLRPAQHLDELECMFGGRWCRDAHQRLIHVFLTYRLLGLWVRREAGGDSGEASDVRPRGSSTCEVPLRLCTESVRWLQRTWHKLIKKLISGKTYWHLGDWEHLICSVPL